jgi:hypothetical protein
MRDSAVIEAEARRYAADFVKQDDDMDYQVGCPDFTFNKAFCLSYRGCEGNVRRPRHDTRLRQRRGGEDAADDGDRGDRRRVFGPTYLAQIAIEPLAPAARDPGGCLDADLSGSPTAPAVAASAAHSCRDQTRAYREDRPFR